MLPDAPVAKVQSPLSERVARRACLAQRSCLIFVAVAIASEYAVTGRRINPRRRLRMRFWSTEHHVLSFTILIVSVCDLAHGQLVELLAGVVQRSVLQIYAQELIISITLLLLPGHAIYMEVALPAV